MEILDIERQNILLRRMVEILRAQRKILEEENMKLKAELAHYSSENTPAFQVLSVEEILGPGKIIAKNGLGMSFVITVPKGISIEPGMRIAVDQASLSFRDVLPKGTDSYVSKMEVTKVPDVSYADIGGLDEQIKLVREVVELPLKNPDIFRKVGIEPPKGILFVGPPGTGKTLLARAVAHETNATFIRVVASQFAQKYVGEGARVVREVFALARGKAPSILFIDELDAIGSMRMTTGTGADREIQRTLMQLLSEMDGFDPLGNVKIIGATNRIDVIDPAMLRPGRFDRIIYFPVPDLKSRKEIFLIHTRRMSLEGNIDLDMLAEMTDGATGATIKAICTEAGMIAIRNGRTTVTMDDFREAIVTIMKQHKEKKSSWEIIYS